MKVRFIRFSDHARTPERAHPGDSGLDLFVANHDADPLWPGETRTFWTDIGIELEHGPRVTFEAQIRPRSSWSRRGVHVQFGTVDSTYRGNIGVTVYNSTREMVPIPRGTKIAQLVIAPVVVDVELELAETLAGSERADKGFGSSGAM